MARWAIANDHAGLSLKPAVLATLASLGIEVEDLGTNETASVDYPDFAHRVGVAIASGTYDFAVLVCGTGIGMSIAANRHAHVRAALCGDTFSAKATRQHNDANVLCLGSRVVGAGVAEEIVRAFATTPFEGGRHARRVAAIET